LSLETDAFGGIHGPALESGSTQRCKPEASAGQIPAASYVSGTLTIDYTNASITADDGTGTAWH